MPQPAIRNRVKALRSVRAGDLRPNPKNWRRHGAKQRAALAGILREVGYADALLARELPGGQLELIDGHLRAETTPDQQVPVLVLDVTEEEADKLLAVIDPLAAMATPDPVRLDALQAAIDFGAEELQAMIEEIAECARLESSELKEGWGETEENKNGVPKNVVCFLGLNVGDVQQFETAVTGVATSGERTIQTIMRGLDALYTQRDKRGGPEEKQPSALQTARKRVGRVRPRG